LKRNVPSNVLSGFGAAGRAAGSGSVEVITQVTEEAGPRARSAPRPDHAELVLIAEICPIRGSRRNR
jgi:hypothetical protein